ERAVRCRHRQRRRRRHGRAAARDPRRHAARLHRARRRAAPAVGVLIGPVAARRATAWLVALGVLVALPAPAAAAAKPASGLSIGFLDGVFSSTAAERSPWLARAVQSEADILRIDIGWAAPNTPSRPPGF